MVNFREGIGLAYFGIADLSGGDEMRRYSSQKWQNLDVPSGEKMVVRPMIKEDYDAYP